MELQPLLQGSALLGKSSRCSALSVVEGILTDVREWLMFVERDAAEGRRELFLSE